MAPFLSLVTQHRLCGNTRPSQGPVQQRSASRTGLPVDQPDSRIRQIGHSAQLFWVPVGKDQALLPRCECDQHAGKGHQLTDPGIVVGAGGVVQQVAAGNVSLPTGETHQRLVAAFLARHQGHSPGTKARFQQSHRRIAAQHGQGRRIDLFRVEWLYRDSSFPSLR